ncbi:hypothetical protein BJX61DRAFT_498293 [Aspergillus egyptiacus]|nr:hypothetical protein BJX61DRAFT_498293 [Aspergillus egyptiacus]
MKQILQDDNDGILVYVAPTKALVNQIAAEIQVRFSKSYPTKSKVKSVWAIHTRDYRINNPAGCQILVTVPHILQIMLLAPSNAQHWSPRVKRIIFDEIHCIGQAEDGVVWEQLLLLAPCPIIALSATVGNPQAFCNWLGDAQRANGIDLEMVEHRHRSSDLRKYIYHPPETFCFHGLPDTPTLSPLDLEDIPEMTFVHPISSLLDRSRGMPDDLVLEPRDCLTLWKAMKKHESASFPVDPSLEPSTALPPIVTKKDVIRWQEKLKLFLLGWLRDSRSPFEAVQEELSRNAQKSNQLRHTRPSEERNCARHAQQLSSEDILETTLPLICSLQSRGALPALFFNYDRSQCEQICCRLLDQFREAEAKWKAESPSWRAKLAKWEEWKKLQEKKSKAARNPKRRPDGGEPQSQASRLREVASMEPSSLETFDPDRPVDGFHIADSKRLQFSQFCEYAEELRRRLVPGWLIDALERGIGVHHAGMNRKYRQVCEILFRRGFLRVVIATGTLALGINMPCKTVVFSGDSVYLTALNFRQASGRAGRRGFDLLGNVVFQGIPYAKVCRLISSKLPDLTGHFPITTSIVLRLFILLHGSGRAAYAVRAVNSILSCARIYLGGPEMKDSVLHHLRFSIEYLQRNRLLDSSGLPLNFAGCVSHLYYTESSGFAFHALLEAGYFHELCREAAEHPKQTLMALMLVLSHIFGIIPLRKSAYASACATKSPSLVVLPPLPVKPAKILRAHNENTRDIYAAYVANYIQQHICEPDCILPLSGMRCGGDHTSTELAFPFTRAPTKVTSAFYALSGHGDNWSTVAELCAAVRSGVWLEESVIPRVMLYPEESVVPLNAYLYDFFNHSNVHELEHANGLRRGDIWFALNDFSLILATIVTSLENFVKAPSLTGEVELGTMGELDAHEAMLETIALDHSAEDKVKITGKAPRQTSTVAAVASAVKQSVADRWDEDISGGEDGGLDAHEDRNIEEQIALTVDVPSEPATRVSMCRTNYGTEESMITVIRTFKSLQDEFNWKFRGMWS